MEHAELARWYAEPLDTEQAQQLLDEVRAKLKQHTATHNTKLRLEEIIARYWLGRDISGDIENLRATCQQPGCRAMTALVYGQLLISHKLNGAIDHLEQGFKEATSLLPASGYLEVMRRHEQLKHLALSENPSKPQGLQDLLNEAAVVKALKGKLDHHTDIRSDRNDTLG